ncbi:MAG TPA: hypothetical protein PKY82_34735 [Pyrinomonadaceae bacterium]|nr:hypothetical protein [Pyrinomonadaceae bacterium]
METATVIFYKAPAHQETSSAQIIAGSRTTAIYATEIVRRAAIIRFKINSIYFER